jgi:hypothetical protein
MDNFFLIPLLISARVVFLQHFHLTLEVLFNFILRQSMLVQVPSLQPFKTEVTEQLAKHITHLPTNSISR